MRSFERLGDLTGDRQRFVEREWALRDAVCERRAVDELEDERAHTSRSFLDTVDLRDVRMIERREHLRLALKSRDAIRVGGEQLGKNLDRDVAAQARVARSIHFAHAARADGGHNLVRADSRVWREGHCR